MLVFFCFNVLTTHVKSYIVILHKRKGGIHLKKLTLSEVYKKADLSHLNIQTTNDVTPLEGEVMRQERAEKSIKFGLAVKSFGYNLFVSGGSSTKKRSYLLQALNEAAQKKDVPNDLLYVHNFEDETQPALIKLPAGKGEEFQKAMEKFSEFLFNDLRNQFKTIKYQKEAEIFFQNYDEKYDELLDSHSEKLDELGYMLAQGNDGSLFPAPMSEEGELLSQEAYDELSDDERGFYIENKKAVDILMIDFMHQQQEIDDAKNKEREELDKKLVQDFISPEITKIKRKFGKLDTKINTYLDLLKKDILENVSSFKEKEKKQQTNIIQIMAGPQGEEGENDEIKYKVNLVVNNKDLKHAPVVFVEEFDPHTFFGAVEFNVEGNAVSTDFTKITAGEMIEANGGYLVLKVEDLFKYYHLWDKFKTTLKNHEVTIQTRLYRDLVISNTLKPESIPLDVKVVLVGDYYWYHLLFENDPEFQELFKIHAVFEHETKRTPETESEYVRFLTKYVQDNELKPFDLNALEAVVEYSSRLSGHQDRLVLNFNGIYKVLDEAHAWAEIEDKETVDLESVERALSEKENRMGFFTQRSQDFLEEGVILINTTGEKVGEINALTVIDYGDYATGGPSKLTANTYRGAGGVISIDRNVKMTGRLHDKAVETVKGFLGKTFASEHPLSLVANVTFEQNYGGVDGDSATSTTLYAILSDMADMPIKQGIAVTGSMNQKGEVQAVGGVNEKIEGFYRACKTQGLTGEQGVILPKSNVKDLMLSKEVREAIENGQFHIYSVEHVSEGIEILTGKPFEEIKEVIFKKLDALRETDKNGK